MPFHALLPATAALTGLVAHPTLAPAQPPVTPLRIVAAFAPPAEPWLRGHRGIDVAVHPGQAVRAPVTGRIGFAGVVADKDVVTLVLATGARLTFEPMTPVRGAGEIVVRGALMGHVAVDTGRRLGSEAGRSGTSHCDRPVPCLHIGLLRNGGYRDPTALVSGHPILKPTVRPVHGSPAGKSVRPDSR